jgi:Undecaprenyl-phosphate glucose phosphotransferase
MNDSAQTRPSTEGLLRQHGGWLSRMLRLVDVTLVGATGWLAYWWYWGTPVLDDFDEVALIIGVLAAASAFPRFGVYQIWRGGSVLDEISRLTLAWLAVAAFMVALAFLTKMGAHYSRIWGTSWLLSGWTALVLSRVVLRSFLHWLRLHGRNLRRIVVVGDQALGAHVANWLTREAWTGLAVIGVFGGTGSGGPRTGAPAVSTLPRLGDLQDIAAYVAANHVDQVWLAMPLSEEAQIRKVLHDLRHSTVDIRMVPDLFDLRLLRRPMTDVAGLPVVELSVSPMSGGNRLLKALEDRILALLILILVSPLLLAIAAAVKLTSPGPILFRQKRHGWGAREIEIYKFRTMVQTPNAGEHALQARRNDPRVTRIGRFLRRTSLDELPQFINVLQGRMSIVGPRPHPLWLSRQHMELIDAYMKRHKVKPGITGWAQINGFRGETDTLEKMQKRVEYDLYYIENWSLWFDIKIILMTPLSGFTHRNAY